MRLTHPFSVMFGAGAFGWASWAGAAPAPPSAPAVYAGSPIKAMAYTNINLTYTPRLNRGKLDAFATIPNLFNADPPQAGFWGNPNPGQFGEILAGDDNIGRFYTAGVRFKL